MKENQIRKIFLLICILLQFPAVNCMAFKEKLNPAGDAPKKINELTSPGEFTDNPDYYPFRHLQYMGQKLYPENIGNILPHQLAGSGEAAMLVSHLSEFHDVNARGVWNETPLHWAALKGRASTVRILLQAGAEVNSRDNYGLTPLHCAAHAGFEEVVQILLEHNADPSIFTFEGASPLHMASTQGLTGTMSLLAEKMSDIDLKNRVFQTTALHEAAWSGNPDAVKFLIRHGASVNAIDKKGETPLFPAIMKGSENVVRVLLEAGADPEIRGSNGTPLDLAKLRNDEKIISLLMKHLSDGKKKQ